MSNVITIERRADQEPFGEKQPTADGYEAVFQVSDAYLHDAAGLRAEDVPDPIVCAILSTARGSTRPLRSIPQFLEMNFKSRGQSPA